MKKNELFLMMTMAVFCCITSCSKEKNNHKEKWMITNIAAINTIMANPEYKEIRSQGNEGSIYYKVITAGDGNDTVKYTSTVSCYYKGWYIADYPEYNIKTGTKFEQHLFDDGPAYFCTISDNGVTNGWKTALQNMMKGDKWEVWVPYQLGYGRNDYKASSNSQPIPGYSTLVFEIEVVNIYN